MKYHLKPLFAFVLLFITISARAASILIPMDDTQKDHLKSYGVAFWVLKKGDTLYFNSTQKHGIIPVSDEVVYLDIFV